MNQIGDRLKRWLAENNRSQDWLAERMGCAQPQLNRLLNGKRKWKEYQIKSAARAIGEQAAFLVEEEQPTNIIPLTNHKEQNYREALEKISEIWNWIKDDPAKRDKARDFLDMAYKYFNPGSPAKRRRPAKAG